TSSPICIEPGVTARNGPPKATPSTAKSSWRRSESWHGFSTRAGDAMILRFPELSHHSAQRAKRKNPAISNYLSRKTSAIPQVPPQHQRPLGLVGNQLAQPHQSHLDVLLQVVRKIQTENQQLRTDLH